MNDTMTPRAGSLCLDGGRRLTYSEAGPSDGAPVVYCHGAIGTPLRDTVDVPGVTTELGVRHIALNRPGIGGSDLLHGRRIAGFVDDIAALADALELSRFSLVGVSAGGAYALAAARTLGTRVDGVAVCSSLSPLCPPHRTPGLARRTRLALSALVIAPGACRAMGDALLPAIRRHPALVHRVMAAHAAPSERANLADERERAAVAASFLEATAYGVRGMVEDYLTYSRSWGFSPAEVTADVQIWHGARDPLVPVEHALQLAVSLPRCRVFIDPDEGHHFFRRRLREILAVLLSPDRGASGLSPEGARELLRRGIVP
jgi:pimeloyl-ACP methyl ester carboxylesterase